MSDEVDDAIEEALEGKPRARELEAMVAALEARRDAIARERDAEGEARRARAAKLKEMDRQIRVLHEEIAITQFVEDSVRVSVARQRLDEER